MKNKSAGDSKAVKDTPPQSRWVYPIRRSKNIHQDTIIQRKGSWRDEEGNP